MRTYKRTSTRGEYGSEVLRRALQSIKDGEPLIKVARQTGVSARTLRRHRDGKVSMPGEMSLGRYNSVFSAEVEAGLVEHIMLMERALFGLTTIDVRRLAFEMAERIKIEHPFNKSTKLAGSDWLRGFLHRHPCISIREPQGTSLNRALGFNRSSVNQFHDLLAEELVKKNYSAQQVWNMDETGLSTVQKPGKILAAKGKRQIGKMTSGERGQTTTVICAISAAGSYVPPVFVFARKRMNDLLMKGSPAGSVGVCSSSGWTDSDIFLRWLQHFVSVTRCSPDFPALLILDGHHSHKTLEAIEYCREHGITLLTLPPHSTHKLQPLDKSFFKALKSAYNVAADTWLRCHPGKRVTAYEIAEIFAQAYGKSATVEKATSGFAVTGLWPFRRDIFSDEDFESSRIAEFSPENDTAAGRVSDVPSGSMIVEVQNNSPLVSDTAPQVAAPQVETGVPSGSVTVEVQNNSPLVSDTAPQVAAPQVDTGVPSGSVTVKVQNPQASDTAAQVVVSHIEIESDIPSGVNSEVPYSPPSHPGLKEARRILAELSPRPKVRVVKNRKRKMETCAVITSSPYKQQLLDKQLTSKSRHDGSGRKKSTVQADEHAGTKRAKVTKSSKTAAVAIDQSVTSKEKSATRKKTKKTVNRTSTSTTCSCLVCSEPYVDPPTEDWIQCGVCNQWAHELCTGGHTSHGYVCDFCD